VSTARGRTEHTARDPNRSSLVACTIVELS
jgi:hypothetical protein